MIFTADSDFFEFDYDRGLLLYIEREDPSPGAIVDAARSITAVYDDHRDIEEHVPGEWV